MDRPDQSFDLDRVRRVLEGAFIDLGAFLIYIYIYMCICQPEPSAYSTYLSLPPTLAQLSVFGYGKSLLSPQSCVHEMYVMCFPRG